MGGGARSDDLLPGLVVAASGRRVVVRDDAGETRSCTVRNRLGPLVCGDRVTWSPLPDGSGRVMERRPRSALLYRPREIGKPRPIAANVDLVLVVVAPAPPIADAAIDRYLVVTAHLDLPAHLVVNKVDLLDPNGRAGLEARFRRFESAGYPVTCTSTKTGEGLDALAARLAGETGVLVGQSGVGKSSLTQRLVPAEEIAVGPLTRSGKLGRHTTSAATLYPLPGGGRLVDSPGVRDFGLWQVPAEALAEGFPEFRPYLGDCRFRDCRHRSEPDCAVLEAVARAEIAPDRLASYHAMLEEMEAK